MNSPEPTIAVVVLRPLARLLRTRADLPSVLLERLNALEARGERVSGSAVSALIEEAVALTTDPDLGLRAAMFTELGDFEALEWVAMSAATWRDATMTACRYARVLNESADYRLEVCGNKAHLILGSSLPMVRASTDFQLAAYHLAISLRAPEAPPELEVWMTHAQPDDISGYRAIFPSAKLVFNAAFDGFVSDACRLDTPLPTANRSLHGVLRAHADRLLAELGAADGVVAKVSADILTSLREGHAAAELTAARLGMTRRTLTRRLAQCGTSYSELLKQARYRTAIHYLRHTAHSVEDIAFLLGFSECSPFIRAFKRWSGYAPLEYRRVQS